MPEPLTAYDYSREEFEARNDYRWQERRVGTGVYDERDVPDEEDA